MSIQEKIKQYGQTAKALTVNLMRWLGRKRLLVWHYVVEKIFKVPEGNMLPWGCVIVRWLMFPVETAKWFWTKTFCIYDYQRHIFTINGIKYSAFLFEDWGKYGVPDGTSIKIVKREDGLIVMERLSP